MLRRLRRSVRGGRGSPGGPRDGLARAFAGCRDGTRELENRFPRLRLLQRKIRLLAPIEHLPFQDLARQGVPGDLGFLLQGGAFDEVDRQYQVVTPQRLLVLQKEVRLFPARLAPQEQRGDHRDEQDGGLDDLGELLPPLFPASMPSMSWNR